MPEQSWKEILETPEMKYSQQIKKAHTSGRMKLEELRKSITTILAMEVGEHSALDYIEAAIYIGEQSKR